MAHHSRPPASASRVTQAPLNGSPGPPPKGGATTRPPPIQMAPPARTTVYVAEDHPVFQEAVARAIEARDDLELAGTARDGRVALEEICELVPDVALLDRILPSLDGVDVIRG